MKWMFATKFIALLFVSVGVVSCQTVQRHSALASAQGVSSIKIDTSRTVTSGATAASVVPVYAQLLQRAMTDSPVAIPRDANGPTLKISVLDVRSQADGVGSAVVVRQTQTHYVPSAPYSRGGGTFHTHSYNTRVVQMNDIATSLLIEVSPKGSQEVVETRVLTPQQVTGATAGDTLEDYTKKQSRALRFLLGWPVL